MLKFDFLKKNPGIVSPTYFLHYFWRKIFLLLYSINRSNFNVWLSLLCEILDNMCIAVVCWQGCNVINFEIFFSLFSTWSKSQDKKSFQGEKKKDFSSFLKGLSADKNCLRPWVCLSDVGKILIKKSIFSNAAISA